MNALFKLYVIGENNSFTKGKTSPPASLIKAVSLRF